MQQQGSQYSRTERNTDASSLYCSCDDQEEDGKCEVADKYTAQQSVGGGSSLRVVGKAAQYGGIDREWREQAAHLGA